MDEESLENMSCSTCGKPLREGYDLVQQNGSRSQCARCMNIAQLIEELIRKQVSTPSDSGIPR